MRCQHWHAFSWKIAGSDEWELCVHPPETPKYFCTPPGKISAGAHAVCRPFVDDASNNIYMSQILALLNCTSWLISWVSVTAQCSKSTKRPHYFQCLEVTLFWKKKKQQQKCDGDDYFAMVSWLRGRVRGVNLTASAFILTHTHHATQLLNIFSRSTLGAHRLLLV